ncbi:RNA polymerase Rpb3/Rpb11 dimerization domain containing protein [Tritrichomonas foetus]|uniref:RNA polymerase Rpb3/Rpb11 dimerization domain containing protein n=1 Tax=Tritrichomonas foetus TaxID=1144522 RepID=A0A1J4K7V9_9EUKA|nr:RNA polymerase Rpb3/Rpb11 dimerization domain containing protein [Tritrichomonas foetus]|eukprot:OHT07569.1 RNA polymerase Rpb3/Rpb11 dimerization domain containing protein [Tritrichomonas foetus]
MSFGYIFNEDTCARVHTSTPTYPEVPETTIEILSYEKLSNTGEDRLVFDMVNAPPSHANALRRTLLSAVPSVALEVIGITKNNGIMPDEMLCHRLGLIPLNIEPKWLEDPKGPIPNDDSNPKTTLLFGLHVIGGDGPEPDHTDANSSWEDTNQLQPFYTGPSGLVTSSHLVWLPFPGQTESIPPVYPLHLNVPITKLRPGQEIDLTARAIKSNGKDHAKFSPVCTVFFRMVPKIEVQNEKLSDLAKEMLVNTCPKHIFDIEDANIVMPNGVRSCSSCRECIRDPQLQAYVTVGKEINRYEFTVESVGVRPAYELVQEALRILREKCEELKEAAREGEKDIKCE